MVTHHLYLLLKEILEELQEVQLVLTTKVLVAEELEELVKMLHLKDQVEQEAQQHLSAVMVV